ncbi:MULTISPECIES: Npun_F5749 family FMN-dependent PPOX-type flavoprotein [Cyanophyceae]|uniref:Npun_F5749 family FMN-dependent PPOX-type flavoprotein n=1 Tax=Cyanophyceae TaxID=3028117 RepID=UPI001688F089|nr:MULTISPECIES: Npun_F5749 family FMN-dependent PPOX-type flavoprotein [Cyanophyceae]MBD1914655.1 pyridoxamine 5'-phosphate oxidase family protein [Phormidium sp. FACHB-77]MBD2032543.1 pyridoxamine 5'-phosphate oxidase family protein [Phormidium sp. FACHB-322]MBD2049401.1 pyridoxamine 5'-phosphate oxidase family protein [Leptolyngbya sp. FACHB-60]
MSDSDPSLSQTVALAPWRSTLARALHRNRSRPYSRYFQLATITPTGRPANRTVVFRGWLPDSNTLTLITDQRSAKVADITAHPWAEACWYFTDTREQFRLAGSIQVVTAEADPALFQARQNSWEVLSDNARQQFYWPHPAQSRTAEADFSPREIHVMPPAEFCLVLLHPDQVDHLELRGEPQNRTLYDQQPDGTWQVTVVNP